MNYENMDDKELRKAMEIARDDLKEAKARQDKIYQEQRMRECGIRVGDKIQYEEMTGIVASFIGYYPSFHPFNKDGKLSKQSRTIYDKSVLKVIK